MVNKRVQNEVLGCNIKNDRMISVRLQGKPFNITVIQVCAQTNNAEEATRPFRTKTQKKMSFIIGDWNAKVGSQETPGITPNLALEYRMKQGKG